MINKDFVNQYISEEDEAAAATTTTPGFMDKVSEYWENVKQHGKDAGNYVDTKIREHPYMSMAGAALAGAAGSLALRRLIAARQAKQLS